MTVGRIFVTVGRLGKTLGGIKKPMKRKFIGERGHKASPEVLQYRNVLYTLDEAFEIFIRAKKAQGLRHGTINGYYEVMKYFKQWLSIEVDDVFLIPFSVFIL